MNVEIQHPSNESANQFKQPPSDLDIQKHVQTSSNPVSFHFCAKDTQVTPDATPQIALEPSSPRSAELQAGRGPENSMDSYEN